MKIYCTQNNGNCTICSLVNHGMDCRNNELAGDYLEDAGDNRAELSALIATCREALDRIEQHKDLILQDMPSHSAIIEAMEKINETRMMPIR